MNARDFSDFDVTVKETSALTGGERTQVIALFEMNYREANVAYMEKSLGTLKFVAIAAHGGEPAGFALGEMRVIDLPRLPQQTVALAGICCIAPEHRRRGLFGHLEGRALGAAGIAPQGRFLSAGRMAHPASFRVMRGAAGVVPKPGVVPTPWQQAVGAAIAQAYGSPGFDPVTFVVSGSGRPIGFPVIEMGEVSPEEWDVFRPVDRSRGDALLGLSWRPDAPEGWDEPE